MIMYCIQGIISIRNNNVVWYALSHLNLLLRLMTFRFAKYSTEMTPNVDITYKTYKCCSAMLVLSHLRAFL